MFDSRLVNIIISLCLPVCLIACGNETLPQESVPSQPLQPLPQTNVRFDSELPEAPATISFIEGKVQILRVDIANWEDAVAGMELKLEDMIKTGDDGTAVIVFFEGSTIELEPNTEIMIQELGIAPGTGSTTIKLWQNIGSTVNRVQKLVDSESQYEIQTPSGSAVVRGSVGRVIVLQNGITLIYNEAGEWWAYAQGQMVPIPPNWYITVIPGNAPGPLVPGQPPPPQDPYEGDGEGNTTGAAPVAQFTASVVSGIAPLEVQFNDQSTGSITSWSWDFGDGVSGDRNPVHTFIGPGIYTVALTVNGPGGLHTLIRTDYIVVWGSWTQTTVVDFSAGTPGNTMVLNAGGGDGSIVLAIAPQSIVQDQGSLIIPETDIWPYDICGTRYLAQTFCAGMWGSLVQVDMGWLQSWGSPAPLVVEIRDCILVGDYYVPTSTVLARTTLNNITEEGTYTAYFSPPAEVIAGKSYSIVLYQQGNSGIAEVDYYLWGTQYYYDTYQQGTALLSDDGGASWVVLEGEVQEDFYFTTYLGQYFKEGTFESCSYDCGSDATFGNISWEYSTLDSAVVRFQVATNNDNSTWGFVGPDGTSSTFYETSGTALWSGHSGDRFIKYRAYLMSGSMGFTPELKSVTIFYR
jgi:PKD repeat protein